MSEITTEIRWTVENECWTLRVRRGGRIFSCQWPPGYDPSSEEYLAAYENAKKFIEEDPPRTEIT